MTVRHWLKGNTHTHTEYSDGDSRPETVVEWYAQRDYDFLFLTDHNVLIPGEHLAALQRFGVPVWQGEEITMAAVHVNGLGMRDLVMPRQPGKSDAEHTVREGKAERLRWAVERIFAQGAVATVNHPNFLWTLSVDDLMAGGDFGLLEVANGHNLVNNDGDATRPSTEVIWDRLLSAGRSVWGVASDDAHHFQRWGKDYSNPGRGWLYVDSEQGSMDSCLAALREGRFYSSSGLRLGEYGVSANEITLELDDASARVELIGSGGAVLATTEGESATFERARSKSAYVRVRATSEDGRQLWTQPLFA